MVAMQERLSYYFWAHVIISYRRSLLFVDGLMDFWLVHNNFETR
jgi:hypothetical protein